jgi:DNA invertase Pin-like site-specific DNA recombinase
MGHLLGYARVSTTDQQPQLQVDALQRAGCYRVFTETASGARTNRPTLEQLLDQLRPGDTLVVWKLDRLGRSLRHLVDTITQLADRGVGFRSLQEAIDTTTPGGKLVFHVFAALAEFERDLIRERTAAGLAAARSRGRHGGRPPVMTADKLQVAQEMYRSDEYTVAAIAKILGVSRASIYRHVGAQAALCLGKKLIEVDKVDDLLDLRLLAQVDGLESSVPRRRVTSSSLAVSWTILLASASRQRTPSKAERRNRPASRHSSLGLP